MGIVHKHTYASHMRQHQLIISIQISLLKEFFRSAQAFCLIPYLITFCMKFKVLLNIGTSLLLMVNPSSFKTPNRH